MARLSQELESHIEKQTRLLGKFGIDCVIVGGVAATLYGSEIPTTDLDVCYSRSAANLQRVAEALQSVNAQLRNVPPDLPFLLDSETLRRGLNFTFTTDIGSIDLLGEVSGLGFYDNLLEDAVTYELFGYLFPVVNIEKLIIAKKAAGRPKDLLMIAELEALKERPSDIS
ncbi:MAG TPA: hypothetical protein VI306_20195 [Pyrinomonadaceae bacterium]